MSPEHLAVTMFLGIFVAVLIGVPLYLALGGLALLFGILGGWAPMVFDQFISRIYGGVMSNEVLPAVPLFIFMGAVLCHSGAAEKLFNAMYRVLGGIRGGLAICTIILCTLFAATAGIVGATETTVGLMALPAMLKRKYNIPLACGVICAGGTLGILIPPSVMLLLYGPIAGLSVAKLFIAAVFPGLLLSGLYIVYTFILCLVKPEYGPALIEGRAGGGADGQTPGRDRDVHAAGPLPDIRGPGQHPVRRCIADGSGRCRRDRGGFRGHGVSQV